MSVPFGDHTECPRCRASKPPELLDPAKTYISTECGLTTVDNLAPHLERRVALVMSPKRVEQINRERLASHNAAADAVVAARKCEAISARNRAEEAAASRRGDHRKAHRDPSFEMWRDKITSAREFKAGREHAEVSLSCAACRAHLAINRSYTYGDVPAVRGSRFEVACKDCCWAMSYAFARAGVTDAEFVSTVGL